MQILHRLQGRDQLRTNVHHTSTWDSTGVDHASTSDNLGVLRGAVVVQVDRQTHQIAIGHHIVCTHVRVQSGVTSELNHACGVDQVDLQRIFGDLISTVDHLAVDVLHEHVIRVEVHRFLSVFIEEAELLEGAFERLTLETNSVNTTTVFGQGRQFATDRADVLARTVQVTVSDDRTSSIQTLIVDVFIIEQRNVVVTDNLLAHVLRHRSNIGQLLEVLFLAGLDEGLLLEVLIAELSAHIRRSSRRRIVLTSHLIHFPHIGLQKFGLN